MDELGGDAVSTRPPHPDRPPGMTGEDVPLYLAFRASPPFDLAHAFFNVRVGPQPTDLRGVAGIDAQLIAQLYAPRLDMLVHDGARWWVIEFHGQAGLAQLGRLDTYPELLCRTYKTAPPLHSLMVCNRVNPFVLPSFTKRQIPVIVYNPPNPQPELKNVARF